MISVCVCVCVCLQHYAVMDASEHRVFLAVEHANSSNVHLYISDRDGASYSLSLDQVVATEDWGNSKPSFDIHVVSIHSSFDFEHRCGK